MCWAESGSTAGFLERTIGSALDSCTAEEQPHVRCSRCSDFQPTVSGTEPFSIHHVVHLADDMHPSHCSTCPLFVMIF